jgi:hypothetical protein
VNLHEQIAHLAAHAQAIRGLTEGLTAEQAAWKPAPDAWSVVEVVNHLYDEECEDFRPHLDAILRGPATPWAPIDPQGWVTQRAYNQRDLARSAANFLAERQRSLAWLADLAGADWDAAYPRPWGVITAGDMLAAWAAHDLLHIRQLVELRWQLLGAAAAPYHVRYAGDWL